MGVALGNKGCLGPRGQKAAAELRKNGTQGHVGLSGTRFHRAEILDTVVWKPMSCRTNCGNSRTLRLARECYSLDSRGPGAAQQRLWRVRVC